MSDAKSLCRTALLALVASTVLLVAAAPGARADLCKPAGPLAQSKCTKDSQCCPGLVCQAPAGPNKNNATMQCMGGCRIGGAFQTPGQRNTAPNNCQSCQPSVSTTAWTNVASGTTCRASAGVCDNAETCTGTSGACPADAKSTAVCRPSAGACDLAESCNGSSNDCPADAKSTAQCRASAGVCDPAESCDGVSNNCPADAKSTAECRASQGACDLAESCDGVNNDCPADALADSTMTCRPAVDADCDIADNCTGASAACPADAVQPNGTACARVTFGTCDSGKCCDGFRCRQCADQCDLDENACRVKCGSDGDCQHGCTREALECEGHCRRDSECPSCPALPITTTTTINTTTTTTMACTPKTVCTAADCGMTVSDGCGGQLDCATFALCRTCCFYQCNESCPENMGCNDCQPAGGSLCPDPDSTCQELCNEDCTLSGGCKTFSLEAQHCDQ